MKGKFRKGLILLVAAMVVCAMGLCACGDSSSGKVKVGYDQNKFEEGQSYTNTSSYNYIFKNAFEDLGWDVEFVGVDLPDVEKAINDGTIDCYAFGYTMQGREDMFAWSEAYMEATPVLLHKTGNKKVGNDSIYCDLSSLKTKPTGLTIAIPAGAVTYDVMSDADKASLDEMGTLKEYPGLVQCKEALDNGEADMILTEIAFLRPLFFSDDYARINFAESEANTYGVAFKKGNEEMAGQMTESLRKVWADGTVKNSLETALREPGLTTDEEGIQFSLKLFEGTWLLK